MRNLLGRIRDRIFADFSQCNRGKFLDILPKNSVGAELGVFRGDFSREILKVVRPKELHLIDGWWLLFGEVFPWKGPDTNGGTLRTREAYDDVQKVIKDSDMGHACVIHVQDDLECLSGFSDAYFDWVYIDSSHAYDQTKKELEILRHKVKPDGVICGHDWQPDVNHQHHGVYKAVNEFCKAYKYDVVKLDSCLQWAIAKV